MLPSGQTLDKVVSPATLALVNEHVGALVSAVPVEAVKQFKPWILAMTLEAIEWQKAGFDPLLGLDKHFYDRAQSQGKTAQGLETTEFQISLFDGMTAEQQERFLAETLKDLDKETASVGKLADAWKAGDVVGVERFVLQDLQSDPHVPTPPRRTQSHLASEDRSPVQPPRPCLRRRRCGASGRT